MYKGLDTVTGLTRHADFAVEINSAGEGKYLTVVAYRVSDVG